MVKDASSYFIDAHCHLSDERVEKEAKTWVKRAILANVNQLMIGGVEPSEWDRQEALQISFPEMIKTSFGIHPWWVERYSRSELDQFLKLLEELIKNLDFHSSFSSSASGKTSETKSAVSKYL